MIEIPFIDSPRQSFDVGIDGATLRILLYYNFISDRYYCSLFKDGDLVAAGRKVILNANIFRGLKGVGKLVCINHHTDEQPNRENIIFEREAGNRSIYLYWASNGEIDAVI